MSISTYQELKDAVANTMARSDLGSQIPNFILLAEARLSRELETREQEKRALATLAVNDEFISLPLDIREIREVKLTGDPNTVLEYKSPTGLDSDYPGTGVGEPRAYSIVGKELKLRPIPDSAYGMEIVYIGGLSALSNSNQTNEMLTRNPDAYLMGAVSEGYLYLMDEQKAQLYDQKFTRIIEEIRKDSQRHNYGTGSLSIHSIYQRANLV